MASRGPRLVGSSAGVGAGRHDATAVDKDHNGMASFAVATGGLMRQAAISGQKFTYKPC